MQNVRRRGETELWELEGAWLGTALEERGGGRAAGNSKEPLSGSKQKTREEVRWIRCPHAQMATEGVTTFIKPFSVISLSVDSCTLNPPSSPKSIYARVVIHVQLILTCMGLGTIKKVLAGGGAGHCTLPSVMSLDLLRRDHHKNL